MISYLVAAIGKVTNTLRIAVSIPVAVCVKELTIPEHTQAWVLRISHIFKLVCVFHSQAILRVSVMAEFCTHGVLGSIFSTTHAHEVKIKQRYIPCCY